MSIIRLYIIELLAVEIDLLADGSVGTKSEYLLDETDELLDLLRWLYSF